jgi:uncharacterized integral membrane protein (TIGR00698 family)
MIAAAASFVANTYGGPVMLLALLLGIALNFLSEGARVRPGVRFTAKGVLKLGVALLGLRIAVEDVMALGLATLLIVVGAMAVTIAAGLMLSRIFGRTAAFGTLIGGATAICGVSAALAIASVLPRSETGERDLAFTVMSVTTLSTVAMVFYPVFADLLGFTHVQTGILVGATIHDVAQVVGAGYAVSVEAGDTATIVKLFRVAMLMPVVLLVAAAFRSADIRAAAGRLPLPLFVLGFVVLVMLNSLGLVPETVRLLLVELSRWCLIAAVAAIGLTTSMADMMKIGRSAVAISVGTTLVLLVVVVLLLWQMGA